MDWIRLLKAVGTASLCFVCASIIIVIIAKAIDLFIVYANEVWFIILFLFMFFVACTIVAYMGMD